MLLAALNIHSVEARHTSYIRYHRRMLGYNNEVKPWVTLANPYAEPALASAQQPAYNAGSDAMNYPSEANYVQAGVDLTMIPGISARIASEAFDEPLAKADVLAILGVPGSGMGSPNAKFFY